MEQGQGYCARPHRVPRSSCAAPDCCTQMTITLGGVRGASTSAGCVDYAADTASPAPTGALASSPSRTVTHTERPGDAVTELQGDLIGDRLGRGRWPMYSKSSTTRALSPPRTPPR